MSCYYVGYLVGTRIAPPLLRQRVKAQMRNERIGSIIGTVFRVLLGGAPKKHN